MKIAVDFDGTIVEHRYPTIGPPIPFAIETLKRLMKDGHKIILWTVREGQTLDEALEYLKWNGIVPYAVNSEFPDASWTGKGVSRKIKADIYIDDCNLGGLPDWGDIYNMISGVKTDKQEHASHSRSHKRHGLISQIIRRCHSSRRRLNR